MAMVSINHTSINWDILSEASLSRIMNNIVIDFKLKDGISTVEHRAFLLKFLKKVYNSLNYPHLEKVAVGYTALPIALRFSRHTIKDMLMEEEAEEDEESLIKLWMSLSKFAQKLYYNPKVVFLHNLIADFWEVMEYEVAKNMLELIIILVSQNETRRYVKYLIKDSLFIKRMIRTELYANNTIIMLLVGSLESYLFENDGASLAYKRLTLLKKLSFKYPSLHSKTLKYFPEELDKSSTNQQNEVGSLVSKMHIQRAMENVGFDIVLQIAKSLRINTQAVLDLYPQTEDSQRVLIELIGDKLESK